MSLLDMLGGQRRGGGMSPITMGLIGLLAYKALKGKGGLGGMLGGGGGGLGGLLGGGLGGLLGGGAAGGLLTGGLSDLLKNFQQNGQGDKVDSWVSTGPNKPMSPQELEQALGQERMQWLMQQTGLPKDELLAGLARELPEAVDKLTPDGRIPDEQEATRLMGAYRPA
jgi:uncharacterized protein YidB (DUF937 family)